MSNLFPRRALYLWLALLAAAVFASAASANGIEKGSPAGFDRFIVQFKAGSQPRKDDVARQHALDRPGRALGLSLNVSRRLALGADLVRSNRKLGFREAEHLMNQLRQDPDVEFVEIDRVMRPTLVPNDPFYNGNQWHYYEATGGIGLPATWDLATGTGVVVAVLDTGITTHSDLAGNLVTGYDFITDLTQANDGNGRDADPSDPGDWATAGQCGPGEPAEDSSWHGTHVAGTVAALTNNSKGVAGVAFNAKVMPVRVLGRCGGYSTDIADAIVWSAGGAVSGVPANANPAEVINLSLGGPGSCGTLTQQAIDFAVNAGVTVVVSAGNDNADSMGYEPANCQNVITVAATTRAGAKASFSNFGAAVDVSAPGGGDGSFIASTWNTGKTAPVAETYIGMQGTSMSAPHVAGTVALMQSVSASSPATVESLLKSTARALPVPCAEGCGSGIINSLSAVTGVGSGALIVSDVTMTEGDAGTKTFTFTVSLSKPVAGNVTFNIATADGTATAGSDYVALNLANQVIVAGATSKNFSVTVNGDTTVEPNETFFVNVSNVSGIAVAKSQGTGVIVNDDATPLTSAVPVSPLSASTGTSLYYSLVVPPGKTSLSFSTGGGTGDADLYVKLGSLPTTTTATWGSEGGTNAESINISNPVAGTYYVLVYAYATISGVSLTGQYTPADQPTISINDVAVSEGNAGTKQATFQVSLSQSSGSPVTFDLATENGTATGGSDFVSVLLAGQSIPAGQTSANFNVTITGDTQVEGNETYALELRNVSGAYLGKSRGQGRINNDDLAQLSIGDVSISEGDSGTSTATFVVRLDTAMPSPVTYDIATSNGSASAGSDYVARALTGRFIDAGRSTQVFEVTINGDTSVEPNETFNVTVSNVSGATVADGTAVGTIVNDDAAATATASSLSGATIAVLGQQDAGDSEVPAECRSLQAMEKARKGGKSVRHCARFRTDR